jgi:hypothetical protein
MTISELTDRVAAITNRGDVAEATAFLAWYAKEVGEEAARSNIGYVTGYLPQRAGVQAQRLFGVEHPLLGIGPRSTAEALLGGALSALGRDPRELFHLADWMDSRPPLSLSKTSDGDLELYLRTALAREDSDTAEFVQREIERRAS